MVDPTEQPLLQECATCGALIDITDEEPLGLVHCPTCGAAFRVRRSFGQFEPQEVLGAGGMGAVYRALDSRLNRPVALKLLRKEYSLNPTFIQQFEHEASITASISHPNVVKVYSTGADHGLLYIAMELVDKGSLDDLMGLQGRIAEVQVLEVGMQIAQGLRAAIQRGLIHRDVKPGNILFADAHHAKIVDFGLAVLMENAGEVGGEIWGTPYYVAPEKLDQKPEDFRSDIYSLGATLFHALAGRPPYEADDASLVALKHLKSQPVSLQAFAPDVSSATAYVINRTLHKDPDQRYGSYDELIEHLEYARTELVAHAAKGPRPKRRLVLEDETHAKAMSWVTVGLLVALLVGGGALYIFRDAVFGAKEDKVPITRQTQAKLAGAAYEPKYEAGRKLIIDEKPDKALEVFKALDGDAGVPQPLKNWATTHAGLAAFLAGSGDEARAEFAKLAERGPYSLDPAEQKLADFFVSLGQKANAQPPPSADTASEYDKSNYEAIALLILALANWNAGEIEQAGPLFRQFQSASPMAPYAWVGEYKRLVGEYLSEFTDFRGIEQLLKAADTPEKKKTALASAKEAAGRIKNAQLSTKANAMITETEMDVTRVAEEQTRKDAEQESADVQALSEARTKMAALLPQLRFAEANAAVKNAKVSGEKRKREKDALAKRTEWLARFKSLLIQDLTAGGYPGAVMRRNKALIAGGVARATDLQVEIRTPYGTVPIPWVDVHPESMITMARTFIRPELPAEQAADRNWYLGVFSHHTGKTAEGQALLGAAAGVKPEYQKQLPIFLEFAQAN